MFFVKDRVGEYFISAKQKKMYFLRAHKNFITKVK